MKIDYAIVSTDGNKLYDGFWDIVKNVWSKNIGIKPVLVTIGDDDSFVETEECVLISYKKIEGVNTGLQSQIARLYAVTQFNNKTCLISDLDMIPMSKSYFVDNAKDVCDDCLLIYTADAYGYNNQTRYPMCYNLASSETFQKIMNVEPTFEEFVNRLSSMGLGWDTDELFWGSCVFEWEKTNSDKIVKLERGFGEGFATRRLDRCCWGLYKPERVLEEYYFDCHSLRPISKHEKQINELIELMEKQNEYKIN